MSDAELLAILIGSGTPEDNAVDLMKPIMKDSSVELVYLLMMTPNGRLIKMKNVTTGGYDASIFDIKMIMREAIQNEAAMILVAHNHPKATAVPSTFDNEATKQLTDACRTLDVLLMDHIIIGEEDFFSYRLTHKL